MKTIQKFYTLIAFCSILAFYSCDDDSDIPATDVPASVKQNFEQILPGVNAIEWEKENGLYKADFFKEGHEGEAWFKPDGTWVRTETDVFIHELPEAVTTYVKEQYPDYRIDDAEWVETPAQNYYHLELERAGKRDKRLDLTQEGTPIA